MMLLLVLAGAMIGAPARYAIDRAIQARLGPTFPWGTLTVNVSGSFLLGLLTATVPAGSPAFALLGTGLCGALTTYSTFGYETLRLIRVGTGYLAFLNVIGNVIAGLAAAFLGVLTGAAF